MTQKSETRKEEIVRTAEMLFKKKGYTAVTMRDIAQAMGIKAASLYNHIQSKQQILSDIIINIGEQSTAGMKEIVAMEFNSSGELLLTCDKAGNYFHLFRIVPCIAGSCHSAVHHLYTLYRGDTPGSVQVKFSSFYYKYVRIFNYIFLRISLLARIQGGLPCQLCVEQLTCFPSPLMAGQWV